MQAHLKIPNKKIKNILVVNEDDVLTVRSPWDSGPCYSPSVCTSVPTWKYAGLQKHRKIITKVSFPSFAGAPGPRRDRTWWGWRGRCRCPAPRHSTPAHTSLGGQHSYSITNFKFVILNYLLKLPFFNNIRTKEDIWRRFILSRLLMPRWVRARPAESAEDEVEPPAVYWHFWGKYSTAVPVLVLQYFHTSSNKNNKCSIALQYG